MNNGKAHLYWDNRRYEYWFIDKMKKYEIAKKDKEKKERLKSHECPYCWYLASRMGGSAMTSWECALCPKTFVSGSTNTPTLCMGCAQNEDRCVQCGGKMFNTNTKR